MLKDEAPSRLAVLELVLRDSHDVVGRVVESESRRVAGVLGRLQRLGDCEVLVSLGDVSAKPGGVRRSIFHRLLSLGVGDGAANAVDAFVLRVDTRVE